MVHKDPESRREEIFLRLDSIREELVKAGLNLDALQARYERIEALGEALEAKEEKKYRVLDQVLSGEVEPRNARRIVKEYRRAEDRLLAAILRFNADLRKRAAKTASMDAEFGELSAELESLPEDDRHV